MTSKPSSVVVYAGKAADHDPRARPAALRLGHEFSRRLGTVSAIIGEPFTATNAGWRAELDDARADFTALQNLAHEAFAEQLNRCWFSPETLPRSAPTDIGQSSSSEGMTAVGQMMSIRTARLAEPLHALATPRR